VTGVTGWYVNGGGALAGNYTVKAADAHPNDYVKDLKQDDIVKYRVRSTNAVYDTEGTRVSVSLFKSRTCTAETAYDVNRDTSTATVYTDNRIIFTPLVESNFITLSFSTLYGEFDYNGSQRISVTIPAGGTMAEYMRTTNEVQSVANFINKYNTSDADEGGYIVLYQTAVDSGYRVIKVPTNGNPEIESKTAGT
jgi:hypothetical protein